MALLIPKAPSIRKTRNNGRILYAVNRSLDNAYLSVNKNDRNFILTFSSEQVAKYVCLHMTTYQDIIDISGKDDLFGFQFILSLSKMNLIDTFSNNLTNNIYLTRWDEYQLIDHLNSRGLSIIAIDENFKNKTYAHPDCNYFNYIDYLKHILVR